MSEREDLRVLAHRMADATASRADASRLSELLRSRPDLHDEYLGFLDTHAALCWEFRGNQADQLEARPATGSARESCGGARRSRTSPWRSPVGWLAAVAVLLVVAFLTGRWQNIALASPTSLVRAAIETHREPVERVYVVTVEPNLPSVPGGTAPRDVRIATQGNRFWLEMTRGDTRWVWGRDLDGAIWLTVASKWAIRPIRVSAMVRAVGRRWAGRRLARGRPASRTKRGGKYWWRDFDSRLRESVVMPMDADDRPSTARQPPIVAVRNHPYLRVRTRQFSDDGNSSQVS